MQLDKKLIQQAADKIITKKKTIATGESVTAGTIQLAFSKAENATTFFQGGITVYNIGQKCRHLKVEPTHAMNVIAFPKKFQRKWL